MKLIQKTRSVMAFIAMVLVLFFGSVTVDSHAAPTVTSSAVALTFDLEVPEDFMWDVTLTVLNTDDMQTYTVTAHYVGGHKNTTYVPSGEYVVTGVDFRATDGNAYSVSIDQDSFSVGLDPVTVTGTLSLLDANECTDEGAFTDEQLASGEYDVTVDTNYGAKGDDTAPEESIPDETGETPEENITEGSEAGEEAPTEAPTDVPSEEGDGLTKVLSTVALILVISLFLYVFVSICKAIQKKRKEI